MFMTVSYYRGWCAWPALGCAALTRGTERTLEGVPFGGNLVAVALLQAPSQAAMMEAMASAA